MEFIKDGLGRGYVAGVNVHNQLAVNAITRNQISFVSNVHGSAYIAYGRRNFVAGNTGEALISFKYIGDTDLFIDQIVFATNSDVASIELYAEHTYISGGTSLTPVNLNRSSKISSNTTIYAGVSGSSGELTVDYVDEGPYEILDLRFGNPRTFTFDFKGAYILRKNDNFLIMGKVENAGELIRASIYYYEEPNNSSESN